MEKNAENKHALKERQFPQSDNKMLKAALGYAERLNAPVIPLHTIINDSCTCFNGYKCSSKGKHPRLNKWQEVATTDRETIIKYWQKWPGSNIGIVTGEKSGFFVLDVDGEEGKESLRVLVEHRGLLPKTVEQVTGSGGAHLLFKYHEGIGNKTNLLPGLDIRGNGGFIVASPSIHESGMNYEWDSTFHPLEKPILDAPQYLLDAIITPKEGKNKKRSTSHWNEIMDGLEEGQGRNSAATSLAGHLFRRYLDPHLIVEIMNLWNTERNKPPLPQSELNTVIDSIAGKELKRREGG